MASNKAGRQAGADNMTSAYYTQKADQIFPIFGVSSIEEANEFAGGDPVIETHEAVYMNESTGSVDFASGWDDLEEVVEVEFDCEAESWVAV